MEGIAGCFGTVFSCGISIVWIACVVFAFWCLWKIAAKMGFEPVQSLFLLIPLFNLYVLYIVATTEWPKDKKHTDSGGAVTPPPPE